MQSYAARPKYFWCPLLIFKAILFLNGVKYAFSCSFEIK